MAVNVHICQCFLKYDAFILDFLNNLTPCTQSYSGMYNCTYVNASLHVHTSMLHCMYIRQCFMEYDVFVLDFLNTPCSGVYAPVRLRLWLVIDDIIIIIIKLYFRQNIVHRLKTGIVKLNSLTAEQCKVRTTICCTTLCSTGVEAMT